MRRAVISWVLFLSACAATPRASPEPKTEAAPRADLARLDSAAIAASAQRDAAQMMASMKTAESACAEARARPLTEDEEAKLGRALLARRLARLGTPWPEGTPGAEKLAAHVSKVGLALAGGSPRPQLPWRFSIVKSELAETASEPRGTVLITTALLRGLTDEAQLAGVLAYEVARVTSGRDAERFREVREVQCRTARLAPLQASSARFDRPGLGLDDEADSAIVLGAFETLAASASLDELADADALAARLLATAGYDVAAYEEVLLARPATVLVSGQARVQRLQVLRLRERATFARAKSRPELKPLLAPLKE